MGGGEGGGVLFSLYCFIAYACIHCVGAWCRSVVVSAGLLRIFGREIAELPMVATTREHQGKVSD